LNKIKKITILWIVLCAVAFAIPNLYAQSNAPKKTESEPGELRRKYFEKERKRSRKGTTKRKSHLLEKLYYKKKSNQTKYPGNISVNPKPKDFTAIKERVERNPSRKSLKAQKNRKSFYRASSGMQNKSYGSEVVLRSNPKLSYKYSSRMISKTKGNNKIKPPSTNYRKSSRKVQKSSGNIFLQPEAKRRDYNEIKSRVERNPGKSMARRVNQQKQKAMSNAAMTQNYRGNVNIKALKSKRNTYQYDSRVIQKSSGDLRAQRAKSSTNTQNYRGNINVKALKSKRNTYQYDSRVIQKSSGDLRAQRVKSSKNTQKLNSSLSANYKGSIVLPSRNSKRLRYEYMSKVAQKNEGDIRRGRKTPGPQFTSNYSGDLKTNDKRGIKQWKKYESKKQTSYAGNLKTSKNGQRPGGNTQITQYVGGIRVYSAKQRQKSNQYNAKVISNYGGDLRRASKQKGLETRFATAYEGDTKVLSQRKVSNRISKKASTVGNYSGNIKALTPDQRKQALQGKAMNSTGYQGNIKVLTKKRQDRFMARDSKITLKYAGTIKGLTPEQHKQELQGKSMNLSDYQGNIRVHRVRDEKDRKQPRMNALMAGFQGDIVITAKERKKLEYQYLSKVQHNYRGEINQRRYKSWVDNRKSKSALLAKYQGNIKTTSSQGNLKEKQYDYMSRVAHNFSGDLKIDRQYARNRYYRNMSDRNSQIIGNYRTKTRLAKDIEEQILSAKVQNYQGGPKTSLFTRIWLSLFDNSGKLEKTDDKTKKPKYDSREYKIWY